MKLVVALTAAGLLGGLALGSCGPLQQAVKNPAPEPAAAPFRAPSGFFEKELADIPPRYIGPVAARPPQRMQIPAIGVDAKSESLNFLDIPKDSNDVGWFDNLSAPGEGGDAVFDGHLDWYTGPAVFWNLAKLKVGDEILVYGSASDQPVRFKVDSIQSVYYLSQPPAWLYSTDGPPQLTLITCDGGWDPAAHVYQDRLLVHSSLETS
jgi:LPXTG-site transpeptidase (sortase) family protein